MLPLYIPSKNIAQQIVEQFGSPTFVTDKSTLISKVKMLKEAFGSKTSIFYALKANYNPAIVQVLKKAGINGIDAVSPFEVRFAKKLGFNASQIIFTGNNLNDEELQKVHEERVLLNIGSVSELERFGKMFQGSRVSIRLNPGVGDGEFEAVITGGKKSKFGISRRDIKQAKMVIDKYRLKVIGVHCHIGSGFYSSRNFEVAIRTILREASAFKNLEFVDFGGGFGVRYKPDEIPVNLKEFFLASKPYIEAFSKQNNKDIEIRFEPGKFLVAESTCLLTRVTTIKKEKNTIFVGTDTGMNHLIRPALYNAYHHIVNISQDHRAPLEKVKVVGNICESSDVLGKSVLVSQPREGDVLAILTAGAYGATLSSLYNFRPYAAEVLIDAKKIMLTRKRQSFTEVMGSLGFEKRFYGDTI